MKDCIDNGTMAHFFPLPPEMFKEVRNTNRGPS